jgi:SAM-dependent methyltransferase
MRNSSRVHLEAFVQRAAASLSAPAMMLDAGAGNCQYRHHFAHVTYESADFGRVDKPYGNMTYTCDLSAIPVESNRYDLVLFTQTLEHLPHPDRVLRELYRVAKPKGSLWLTAPLFYEEHEQPYDFYRYTRFGMRQLVEDAGFQVQELEPLEGYCGTVSYQLDSASRYLPWNPRHYNSFFTAACVLTARPFMRLLANRLSKADIERPFHLAGFPKSFRLIATK